MIRWRERGRERCEMDTGGTLLLAAGESGRDRSLRIQEEMKEKQSWRSFEGEQTCL